MPSLGVLRLMGNPVVKRWRHYRKTVLAALPRLKVPVPLILLL
jgi:hypothetical protein